LALAFRERGLLGIRRRVGGQGSSSSKDLKGFDVEGNG